jgi:hypothetical protein
VPLAFLAAAAMFTSALLMEQVLEWLRGPGIAGGAITVVTTLIAINALMITASVGGTVRSMEKQ